MSVRFLPPSDIEAEPISYIVDHDIGIVSIKQRYYYIAKENNLSFRMRCNIIVLNEEISLLRDYILFCANTCKNTLLRVLVSIAYYPLSWTSSKGKISVHLWGFNSLTKLTLCH